jgi:hypothetical protein
MHERGYTVNIKYKYKYANYRVGIAKIKMVLVTRGRKDRVKGKKWEVYESDLVNLVHAL